MGLAGRKALDHRWTKVWRRAHKKESILSSSKKSKNKRTLKSERGIEGLSLQELLRKKNESAEQRKKAVDEKKKRKAKEEKAEQKEEPKGGKKAVKKGKAGGKNMG